jgi:hypothetical protein
MELDVNTSEHIRQINATWHTSRKANVFETSHKARVEFELSCPQGDHSLYP